MSKLRTKIALRTTLVNRVVRLALCAADVSLSCNAPILAQERFTLSIVAFLSGSAAENFGFPAGNAAKVLID
jgi:branched-chain amino acid transport system substrate-binding protein